MEDADLSPARLLGRRAAYVAAFLVLVAGFGMAVYTLALRAEMEQTVERGRADLLLAADRLTASLQRYRELAVLLADHPVVVSAVLERGAAREETGRAAARLLQETADKTGAIGLSIHDVRGRELVASGEAYATDDALTRALDGALGMDHYVEAQSGARRFLYAAPVFAPTGGARGVIVVFVDIGVLEYSWPTDPSAAYFTDTTGLVFVTNRSELALLSEGRDLPFAPQGEIAGHEVWAVDAGPYLPSRAVHLSQPLPVIGLNAHLLLDVAPVRVLAGLQAGLVAALCLAFGAMLFLATERRRTLAEANARLEARVAARTQALEVANRDLKRAQADLVQAGKLSALGQMSAGISHELNQPLMAIRSFAENAQAFLERGNPAKAGENLGRISELARRMGRIIKNLRAFARQEKESISDVDLTAVVEAAIEMTEARLARGGVTLDWQAPPPVWVRGGEVRLQQVLVNLLSNAADAMADSAERRITLRLAAGDPVVLTVRDTGPGIAEPDKIFDPFYTTKEVGASEGMGLGLSISYGLIQSFGGQIKGANPVGGGAEFTLWLTPAQVREAAE